MLDFLLVSTKSTKKGNIEIYPKFIIKKSKDLMIRGGDFYAVWNEKQNLWSTDEQDALRLIDECLDIFARENEQNFDGNVRVLHMWDAESGMIDKWHKYCQKQMRDNFHPLDEKIMFSNAEVKKDDYASKTLPYPLKESETPAYDKLIGTLYSPEERHKIEWAIGSIVQGDSKTIQKFIVLYGAAGSGKSTILNIIQQLFSGYYSVFDARALGSSNNSFALEAFKSNPLVAIQHDGDLSRIEDNTRLNSLVSHELMTVNEKFKATYSSSFKSFLFMGTNKPVRITDGKSGLIRRLIDVTPTGDRVSIGEYRKLMSQIEFELGGIANHCKAVYLENPHYYDEYVPLSMLGASNDFYNFVLDSFYIFKEEDMTTLKAAWEMYKTYCEEAKVPYPYSKRVFKEELKNYFKNYEERGAMENGTRLRNVYTIFRVDKFDTGESQNAQKETSWIELKKQDSIFDLECSDCPAQYANSDEIPKAKWADVTTKLSELKTGSVHYVRVPENHIVIDFDIKDADGNKNLERNLAAASKWPPTYTEVSKGGKGLHLHYIYDGDVTKLANTYSPEIEIKVFTGLSSLRRKLTKCNDIPIRIISSGLPLKEGDTTVTPKTIKREEKLVELIERNLRKEIHPGTKPSIDFIFKILEDAYNSDLHYDVSFMRKRIFAFAAGSSNHASYCMKRVGAMKFKSKDIEEGDISEPSHDDSPGKNSEIVFFDIEVFPNLTLVMFKFEGLDKPVIPLINPSPTDISDRLLKYRLVGFNNRKYDNHILYALMLGWDNERIYKLSKAIVSKKENGFHDAYSLSYTDIFDFSSKKQSLKKFEIEIEVLVEEAKQLADDGASVSEISKRLNAPEDLVRIWIDDAYSTVPHKELGLPWDEPVPEELWPEVVKYCENDVKATEAMFNYRKADFVAREILADLAESTVNSTTNSLTTKFIFGNNRHPQNQFNYRDMALNGVVPGDEHAKKLGLYEPLKDISWEYVKFTKDGKPVFPGYIFESGVSTYRGETVGEGGYVYANPGMYGRVTTFDVASMHPSSIVAEELFGDRYTSRFNDILDARIAIKHKDFDRAKKMLDGKLSGYLTDEKAAKRLAGALKIAINSVYGLTAARFENPFRDIRNIDNIVAKRGALFMINLRHVVEDLGYTVIHIKTDSIKILDADDYISNVVNAFGQLYGYNFEIEHIFDKICLVNDAVYVGKFAEDDADNPSEWNATGAQFQVPYVFKTIFTKQPITFNDLCETKSVTSSLYLDMGTEENHDYQFIGRVGRFCPMKHGGTLLREKDGKYYAATGTKGYLWMESVVVKELHKEDDIDISYYENLKDKAVSAISKFGDIEEFTK